MGGITAVATHAGEIMRAALGGMRERRVHLSMLHPFAHSFYRRYGWELATEAISYRLKPTDLPTSSGQKRIRDYREGDLPPMMALLEGESSRHPLCVRRGEAHWRTVLGREKMEAAVYEMDRRAEGYLLYEQGESRNMPRTLTVFELVADTPAAREALRLFMAVFDPLMFEVRYSTPRREPLHPFLPSSYIEARVSPEFMLRLVNVEEALGILQRRSEAPLVLEVGDDKIPENTDSYTVGGSNGDVVRGARASERVTLDVRELAQLYAGYLPVRQLIRSGLIKPSSARAVKLLEEFFPPGDPWLFPPDHF